MADIRPLSLNQPSPEAQQARLKKATEDFEALFLSQLWKQMRQGVAKDGLFHSKEGESYVGMFDQEMGVKLAEAGGIGLGDMLFRQLQAKLERAGQGAAPAGPLSPPRRPAVARASEPAASEGSAQAEAEALAQRIVAEKGGAAGVPAAPVAEAPASEAPPAPVTTTASLPPGEGIWLTW